MSDQDRNPFGGANPLGLYVPMSEDEMEVIDRLVKTNDLEVEVEGWGKIDEPIISFGDLRISIPIHMTFGSPALPTPVHFFDLCLRRRNGQVVFRERQPAIYNNMPIQVCAGLELDMVWDIALHSMDPTFVKAIKPGALGFTSRRQDKDTKEMTRQGNMTLDDGKRWMINQMAMEQAEVKKSDLDKVVKATKDAGQEIKRIGRGLQAPDVGGDA